MIRALIFDFDGTILDTETPGFLGWQHIYANHNHTITFEDYSQVIGTDFQKFDPRRHLDEKVGQKLDWTQLDAQRRDYYYKLIDENEALPGVRRLLAEAAHKGLPCAIASSSQLDWVTRHLQRLELFNYFTVLSTVDEGRRPKPAPDVYAYALAQLKVSPNEVIAIEDSPHGFAAARSVGIPCVVVPNEMTNRMKFPEGHRRISSLEEVCLETLHLHGNR